MLRNTSIVAGAWVVAMVAGCASAASSTSTGVTPTTGTAAPVPTPSETATTRPTPSATATASAPADNNGVSAEESNPPGVQPLTDQEAQEAELKCTKLGRAIEPEVKAARKAGKSPYEAVLEALKNPPAVAGMDVPRCADLMRRDVIASQALNMEAQAKNNLKAISVGLSRAMDRTPPEMCASAAPVPANLDQLRNGPWQGDPATTWEAPGWKCVGFNLRGVPQYFQYELKSNPADQSYEIIARGFPVAGQPATELFLRVKAENGKLQPSSDVRRR